MRRRHPMQVLEQEAKAMLGIPGVPAEMCEQIQQGITQRREHLNRLVAMPRIPLDEARQFVGRWSNSYQRLDWLFEEFTLKRMDRADWLTLLGEQWDTTDNIYAFIPELRYALGKKRPVMEMMTAEELAAYDALSDVLIAWRGCGPGRRVARCRPHPRPAR